MTTQAAPQNLERPAAPAPGALTAPLPSTPGEPTFASLERLDHRTRQHAVPLDLAPSGHYLAFGEGERIELIPLERRITHIGRGLSCDVRLEDQHVSRDHAIVVLNGRHARVLDNRSSHGTFVNAIAITATDLHDGDIVRLGPVAIQYLEIKR